MAKMRELMFTDIHVGDYAEATFPITAGLIDEFARVSGDRNPIHTDEEFAKTSLFGARIAHGMLGASFISNVAGNQLPGPNTLYLGQTLQFLAPVFIGDTLTVHVEVTETIERGRIILLSTVVRNQHGDTVISGEAKAKKVR